MNRIESGLRSQLHSDATSVEVTEARQRAEAEAWMRSMVTSYEADVQDIREKLV
eukprot:gene17274-35661_t